jgi:O-antigen ligase
MIVDRPTRPTKVAQVPAITWLKRGSALAAATLVACVVVYLAASSIVGVAIVVGAAIVVAVTAYLWNDPLWLLPLAVYVVWFEILPPGPASSGRIVAFLAVFIPVARVLTSNWRPPAIQARVWLPHTLLLLWAFVSLAWSDSIGSWATGFLTLWLGFAYAVLFALFVKSPDQLFKLLRPFIIIGVVIGVISLVLHYGFGYRAWGVSGGPNEYGAQNVEAIPACVVMAMRSRGRWRWFYWLSILIFFGGTLAAGSRSALIAMFAIVFFCCCCRPGMSVGQRARWFVAALVVAVGGFLVAGFLDPERFSLLGFLSDRGAGRLDIWTAAVLGLKEHWLLGYGIGGFQTHALALIQRATGASLTVARQPSFKDTNNIPAHNLFFDVSLDLGMIGVVIYFAAMANSVRNLIAMLKTEWRDLAWVGLGVFIVIGTAGPFGSALNPKLLWAFIGLPGAYFVTRNVTTRSRRRFGHLTRSGADVIGDGADGDR